MDADNKALKKIFTPLLVFLALMWLGYFLSFFFSINFLGIIPRSIVGLRGILFGPFLHVDWTHLLNNTSGIMIFGIVFSLIEKEKKVFIVLLIMLIEGVLVWLLARPAIHLGASGVVFGLFGYLISVGFFKKQFLHLVISIFMMLAFGTMIYGVLPVNRHISIEGHLFGLVSGVICAYLFNKKFKKKKVRYTVQ